MDTSDSPTIDGLEMPYTSPFRFRNAFDLWTKYNDTKDKYKAIYKAKQENYVLAYQRTPTVKKGNNGKSEPSFGQFKFKIMTVINTFINLITERKSWMSIETLDKKVKTEDKSLTSERITECFHKNFIDPWTDRFRTDARSIFDMVMFGKGIEHWFDPTGYKSENIAVEKVFPDTNAFMEPESYDYLFIERPFTLGELYCLIEEEGDDDLRKSQGWNIPMLKSILKHPSIFKDDPGDVMDRFRHGNIPQSQLDTLITLVFAYVKEYKEAPEGHAREGYKISLRVFPANGIFFGEYKDTTAFNDAKSKGSIKSDSLMFVDYYAKCFNEIVSVRMSTIIRSYYESASIGDELYVACRFYDQAMNMVIRACMRSMQIFLQSENTEQQNRLRSMGDQEFIVLDPDTTLIPHQLAIDVSQMTQTVRQIMFDNEQGMALGQSPGSQNVKGYAITAKEAQLRSAEEQDQEAVNIKLFISNDVELYREIYRRCMNLLSTDDDYEKLNRFKQAMKEWNIPPSAYDPENVLVKAQFNVAGAGANRIAKYQQLLQATAINPQSAQEEKAQRGLISAIVGESAVEDYIKKKDYISPVYQKAGSENEDMDSPTLNPANVPVLPTDTHLTEIPIHLGDYNTKLQTAIQVFQSAQGASLMRKCVLIGVADDLVKAQDNKGAHIQAHFKIAMQQFHDDKARTAVLDQMMGEYKKLQRQQDQLKAQIDAALKQFETENQQNVTMTMEQQHLAATNQIEIDTQQKLSDIKLRNAMEKHDVTMDQKNKNFAQKYVQDEQANNLDTQKKVVDAHIDVNKEIEKQQAKKNAPSK